ncbi:NepR family anti-sigma factor [Sphingomonas sp.]|uniref:NepR family anti-sigma factor n=1 Tax=Sphingomonas sp. TaxID=28214 RepID=UPI003CC5EE7C
MLPLSANALWSEHGAWWNSVGATKSLAEQTDKAPRDSRESAGRSGSKRGQPDRGAGDAQMGAALRSVYQKTVEESVPAEMLDLLSKLD